MRVASILAAIMLVQLTQTPAMAAQPQLWTPPVLDAVVRDAAGVTWVCSTVGLNLTQLQICQEVLSATPPDPVTVSPRGWVTRLYYGSYVDETCGYYRAHDGDVSCSIVFLGQRRLMAQWYYYHKEVEEYRTHGVVHNYANRGGDWPWAHGVDGGLNPHNEPSHWCYIRIGDERGTWGIGVRYEAKEEDGDEWTGHRYIL